MKPRRRTKARAPRSLPRLSASEWELMLVCWTLGASTAARVHEAAAPTKTRNYMTTSTLLDRMARKGYLEVRREGRQNVYTPSLPFDEGVRAEIRRFLRETLAMRPKALEILDEELASAIASAAPSSRR